MKAYRTLDHTLLTEIHPRTKSVPGTSRDTRQAGSGHRALTEDPGLLEAFREGSAPALSMIYSQYAPIIAAFLARGFSFQSRGCTAWFKGFKEPYDLENCLQETFVRAFSESARRSYNGVSSYLNYLLAIARNIVIDESRRRDPVLDSRRVELNEPLLNGDMGLSTPAETPEHNLVVGEILALWEQFKGTLPLIERRYADARFVQARVRKLAAEECSLSLMQARTLERKLQRLFLKFMQEHNYLETYRSHADISLLKQQPSYA